MRISPPVAGWADQLPRLGHIPVKGWRGVAEAGAGREVWQRPGRGRRCGRGQGGARGLAEARAGQEVWQRPGREVWQRPGRGRRCGRDRGGAGGGVKSLRDSLYNVHIVYGVQCRVYIS